MKVRGRERARFRGRKVARIFVAALSISSVLASLRCAALRGFSESRAPGSSGTSVASAAPILSPGKALAQAREALGSKDLAKALRLYEIALQNSKKPDDHAEALFGSGMVLIDPDPGVRDTDRGRARLEELARLYPGRAFQVGAIVALDVTEEAGRLQSELKKLREDSAMAEESWKKEKEELIVKARASAEEADKLREEAARQRKTTAELQEVVSSKEADLQQLRTDLDGKNEALKKAFRRMKGALVRQGAAVGGGKTAGPVTPKKTARPGGAAKSGGSGPGAAKTGGAGASSNMGTAGSSRGNAGNAAGNVGSGSTTGGSAKSSGAAGGAGDTGTREGVTGSSGSSGASGESKETPR